MMVLLKINAPPIRRPDFRSALTLFSAAVCGGVCTMAAASVGEVSLTVGKGWVTSASGTQTGVLRGHKLEPGDQIETGDSGHVHVRFIDGAFVSVRPSTRLVIENYQFDPQHPDQSTVRFRLEKGVARAISGAAAENAKERFRLNTPLVAIGVRGTDFVVRTDPQQTLAAVNQGSIVMAPLGEGCAAGGLGVCRTDAARLLSADMGSLIVEYRPDLPQPELKGIAGTRAVMAGASPAAASMPRGGGDASPAVALAPARGDGVRQEDAQGNATVAVNVIAAVNDAAATIPPKVPEAAPQPPIPQAPPTPPALAWGRWAGASQATDFSLSIEEARVGREITVGTFQYALFRTQAPDAVLTSGLGSYDFSLQQAHAHLSTNSGQVLPATVQNGTLQIDFAGGRFATSLNVTSALSGAVNVAATGTVRDDGMFATRSANQVVAGATSIDGKTAGYTFEKLINSGTLAGVTLWSR